MFQFNSGLNFTTKVPYQFARAHVRDAPNHFVSFTIELNTIKEIYRCTNFHAACSKFPEIRGLLLCTCVARAPCTIISQALHHRIALVEKNQCIKFRVTSSKVPESESAYPNAQCTCISRALCIVSRNNMYHRITLIRSSVTKFHQCTKFGVNSSKFYRTGGPLTNKLFRYFRAQPASYRIGNHKNI